MSSGNDDGTIRAAYEQLVGGMKMGKSPEASAADLLMLGLSRDIVELALERVRQRAEEARVLRIPEALVDREGLPSAWYQGPSPGDRCWPALEQDLRRRGLKATAVESIESASTKIVGLLAPPWENPIRTRGLVLGYVQSGKTSNFTAVTAKAADAGYRLFIVLSGMHNNLRRQTQTRLDEQLVELNKDLWLPLTSDTADFGRAPNPDALLTISDRRFLCVVKKNASRMRRLVSWLSGADNATLESCPILVIDDEADQASVNTAAEEEERTAINRCLSRTSWPSEGCLRRLHGDSIREPLCRPRRAAGCLSERFHRRFAAALGLLRPRTRLRPATTRARSGVRRRRTRHDPADRPDGAPSFAACDEARCPREV